MFQLKITSCHKETKEHFSYIDSAPHIVNCRRSELEKYAVELVKRNDHIVSVETQPFGMDVTLKTFA